MIFNSFGVLDSFLTIIRMVLGVWLLGLAVFCKPSEQNAPLEGESGRSPENRRYLIGMISTVLLGMNVVGWPLLYALLHSYVPQWPGVMCIYGVTRIGTGSEGPSRFLPGILASLQITKPLIVFLSGAWLALYLASRHAPTKIISRRILASMLLVGGLSVVDAALEGTYLIIPKKERFLEAGCCSVALPGNGTHDTEIDDSTSWHNYTWAYLVVSGLLSATLGWAFMRGTAPGTWTTGGLFGLAVVSIPVFLVFLNHVAAPTILGIPYHHCAYDLVSGAPVTLLGIVSFFLGCFSVGWLAFVQWSTEGSDLAHRLVFLAFFGYTGSLCMFVGELYCG